MEQTILKLIQENQIIMLDTSVAMDNQFNCFVEAIEIPLMENRRKITVKKAVWAELLRHLGSSEPVKQKRATVAVEIIGMHHNIFEIDDYGMDSEKILRAFADAEFFVDLMIHKNRYTQALLTNDKKLCRDVNKLNEQESCMGKKISVYSLNYSGDIVFEPYEEEAVPIQEKVSVKNESKENSNIIPIVGSSSVALILGVVIGKYAKQMLNLIKTRG